MSKIICLAIIIVCTFGFAQERVVANPQLSRLETKIAELENQITELKKLLQKNEMTKKSADFTPESREWLEGTMGWTQTGDSLYPNTGTANVGIGTSSPTQRLDIDGAIKVGSNVENADSTGAIRWDGSHFEGYNGTAWVVLDIDSTAADNDWTISGNRLYASGDYGLAMRGANMFYGIYDSTHINFGIACTTGYGAQDCRYSTVNGGFANTAYRNLATVGGGGNNKARGHYSVVCGGGGFSAADSNSAYANYVAIGGGKQNIARGQYATISGGLDNMANDFFATVGGGTQNIATSTAPATTISGGENNYVSGDHAAVSGGADHVVSGTYASVGGGLGHTVDGGYATIGGGYVNSCSGNHSTICGGRHHHIEGSYSAILGGIADTIAVSAHCSYLFGIGSKLTQDSTFMIDMPHIRFGDETNGYEFPTSDGTNGQVMATDGSGQLSWSDAPTDNDWVISGNNMYSAVPGSVGVGVANPTEKLDVNGAVNVSSVYKIGGDRVLSNAGTNNIFIGVGAGENNTTGNSNTFLGDSAGYFNTTGYNNTFSGHNAGYSNTEGWQNTFTGRNAGYFNTTGYYNTFSGYAAGFSNTTGYNNTFSGSWAGYLNTTGHHNTFSGRSAGVSNTTGYRNTFSGVAAGYYNTTGSYNTFSGNDAGYLNAEGDSNVFIGYRAGYNETGSNKLYIANDQNDANVLIYGEFDNRRVGIGTVSPTATLDVSGSTGYNQIRMRTSCTPSGTGDTNGNVGDIGWDDDYIYLKTNAGWKRTALSTW